jgi:hypothetical protein
MNRASLVTAGFLYRYPGAFLDWLTAEVQREGFAVIPSAIPVSLIDELAATFAPLLARRKENPHDRGPGSRLLPCCLLMVVHVTLLSSLTA